MSENAKPIVKQVKPVLAPGEPAWNTWGAAALFVACIAWLFFPAGIRTRELVSFAAMLSPVTGLIALILAVLALTFSVSQHRRQTRGWIALGLSICPMVGYALRFFWGLF